MLLLRAIVAIPVLLLAGFEIWLARQLYRVDEYFVCEGVTNGTALGETFPVPDCLQDQTTGDDKVNHIQRLLPSWGEFSTLALWGTIGALTATWWLMVLRKGAAVDSGRATLLYSSIDQQDGVSHNNDGEQEMFEDSSENFFNDEEDSSSEGDGDGPSF